MNKNDWIEEFLEFMMNWRNNPECWETKEELRELWENR